MCWTLGQDITHEVAVVSQVFTGCICDMRLVVALEYTGFS